MGSVSLNSEILRDIERKVKGNKAIPTVGFEHRTLIYRQELDQTCDVMSQDIHLMYELFLPRGITATVKHLNAGKRTRTTRALFTTIVAGLAVLTGLFSAARIFQLR